MMYLYPYNSGSKSALALVDALEGKMIRREASRFKGNSNKVVINWGSSDVSQEVSKSQVLNKAPRVAVSGNKLSTLKTLVLAGVRTPQFTPDRNKAIAWLEQDLTLVARHVLTGHSGNGISILEKGLDFDEAPCYTVYVPKSAEYRVHVFRDRIVDIQRKVKDPERDVLDWKVRSHKNGFIFIRNTDDGRAYKDVAEQCVKDQALMALKALQLDFGAVDILYNKKKNQAFVLECNCAPGLIETTVDVYAKAFKEILGVK